MKQLFEFSFFLAGATALHLSVGYVAPSGQTASAGAGGDAAITLAAATASVQDMVTAWDQPVSAAQTVAQPLQTPDQIMVAQPLAAPTPDRAVSRPAAVAPPLISDAPALPQVDRSVPPPPQPEIAQTRPKLRPPAPAKTVKKAEPAKPKPKAATKPKSSSNVAPQKAAGGGAKATRGQSENGAATKSKPGNSKQLMAQWGGQIRASVERRKRYPSGTRARGTVTLVISVHTRGTVASVSLRKSSGIAQIDRAAIAAVKSARISAAPKGLAAGVHSFTLPMKFAP